MEFYTALGTVCTVHTPLRGTGTRLRSLGSPLHPYTVLHASEEMLLAGGSLSARVQFLFTVGGTALKLQLVRIC